MNITRDNYESFFLDYLEGNLEESLIDQFLDFLERNPDLKEELQLFETIRLPGEPVSFEGKKQLYKSPAHEQEAFELKSIAWMEGDLKEEERRSFEAYLAQHPELKKEAALMQSTRLAADTGIRYPGKHQLYKASGTVVMMKWLGRAAALLVLLWGISTFFESEKQKVSPNQPKEVAAVKVPSVPSPGQQAAVASGPAGTGQRDEIVASSKAEPAKATHHTAGTMTSTIEEPAPVNDQMPMAQRDQGPSGETPVTPNRQVDSIDEIHPLMARLEREPAEADLAVSRAFSTNRINTPGNVVTLEEYLAQRARKATDEGLLSAHRLIRAGLNVASELSGDRIGYRVKEGKVTTVDFESKLLAFSIPLEKNKK